MIIKWIRANILPVFIVAAIIVVLGVLLFDQWQRARGAETSERIAKGQRGAAIESGSDAVQTIGNTQASETETHQTVKDATNAINSAPAGDSNDTAERAACGLRAYRHTDRCITLLDPAS